MGFAIRSSISLPKSYKQQILHSFSTVADKVARSFSTISLDTESSFHWCNSPKEANEFLTVDGKIVAVKVGENLTLKDSKTLPACLATNFLTAGAANLANRTLNIPFSGYTGTDFSSIKWANEQNKVLAPYEGRMYITERKEIAKNYAKQKPGVPVILEVVSSDIPRQNDPITESHLHKYNYFQNGSHKICKNIYWLIERSYEPFLEERPTYTCRKNSWNPIYQEVFKNLPNLSQENVFEAFSEDVRSRT